LDAALLAFLHPHGVVVVGASTSPDKLGYGVARNLVESKYGGAIHFVGQKKGELFRRPIYPDLARVPDPVDLAVLVIPAAATPEALNACASRGIHAAIVVGAGFREAGPEGMLLEKRCLEIARAREIRLLGPNCIGTIDTHLPLDTTFLQPPMPPAGGIGFVSHSGAFCAAIVDWSRSQGFGFSQIVSLGNQADVNETDMLPVVAGDPNTRVVALYMEGVSHGVRFVHAAREVTRKKPVVALKVGRLKAGKRAAASHTGALASSDVAFDAAFARAGIYRADSAEQLFDWARALESCPLPGGRRVAVLTDAGGPGVIAADALETYGMQLAALGETTRGALVAELPPAASIGNPVDMLASASPVQYARCLKVLLAEPGVDAVLVILPPPPVFSAEAVAEDLIPLIHAASKPVVIALMGSRLTKAASDLFNGAHVPTYPFPDRAASALAILARREESVRAADWGEQDARPFHVDASTGMAAADLVAAFGIPTSPLRLATSAKEAASLGSALGFPVAMKIASAQISHKSDVGGVLLDLANASEVEGGYAQLTQRVASKVPAAVIDGVHLQQQIPPGQDVIIGAVRDPQFGPLMMFGSGGVEAEGIKDVAFALAPLGEAEADDLMMRTWAGRRLDGFRGQARADKAAARDALIRLSWLACEHSEISEIEINPLRVLTKGVVALDIRGGP
jgi:acetyltransferase